MIERAICSFLFLCSPSALCTPARPLSHPLTRLEWPSSAWSPPEPARGNGRAFGKQAIRSVSRSPITRTLTLTLSPTPPPTLIPPPSPSLTRVNSTRLDRARLDRTGLDCIVREVIMHAAPNPSRPHSPTLHPHSPAHSPTHSTGPAIQGNHAHTSTRSTFRQSRTGWQAAASSVQAHHHHHRHRDG